jgi:hypothetical protein
LDFYNRHIGTNKYYDNAQDNTYHYCFHFALTLGG